MNAVRLAAAACLLAMAGAGALAHTKMTASTPADGATVPAGLSQIEMAFSHPMRLTLVRVRRAGDDTDLALKTPLPKTFTDAATASVEALGDGSYEVTWTAVSQDGHVMKGHFAFTVAGGGAQ
jgi:copper resistance protein C